MSNHRLMRMIWHNGVPGSGRLARAPKYPANIQPVGESCRDKGAQAALGQTGAECLCIRSRVGEQVAFPAGHSKAKGSR